MNQSSILFVVSAPSGAGKTSLLRELVAADEGLRVSVSHTTRAMRPGEVDGIDYHFVEPAVFQKITDEGGFVEQAQVFDNFYGTAEATVRESLDTGQDLVLEIDWQGARQVRQRFPDCVSIFVAPPSLEALQSRLAGRGQDAPEIVARRMRDAQSELSHYPEYDYLVVNDRFDQALLELTAIVAAERLRLVRQAERHRQALSEMLAPPAD